jgi:hypothetical protein
MARTADTAAAHYSQRSELPVGTISAVRGEGPSALQARVCDLPSVRLIPMKFGRGSTSCQNMD